MAVLITGGTGALGSELKKIFKDPLIPTHQELDITKRKNADSFFEQNEIEMIIHTAAITSVRHCEENKSLAWNTNVQGTKNLVEVVKNQKIK